MATEYFDAKAFPLEVGRFSLFLFFGFNSWGAFFGGGAEGAAGALD
jgi:hypothetical protein